MKRNGWAVSLASLLLAAVVYTAGGLGDRGLAVPGGIHAAEKASEKSGGPPPLMVDKGGAPGTRGR